MAISKISQNPLSESGHSSESNDPREHTLSIADRDFDYFQVVLNVEYLPGNTYMAPISVDYVNYDLALISLKHIQKTHPLARLYAGKSFISDEDSDYRKRLKRAEKQDSIFLARFSDGEVAQ